MIYSYAQLSPMDLGIVRFLGTGLGNLLFSWARSIVASCRYGLSPIWPTWPQFKIGTFLRMEKDKRFYYNLFSNRSKNYISGLRKLYLLVSCPHISEEEFNKKDVEDVIVIFKGMRGLFQPILKDHTLVKKELLRIVHEKFKKGLFYDFQNSISVHVRMGDFSIPRRAEDLDVRSGRVNYRLPLSWYVSIIRKMRNILGNDVKIYIFSDGTDDELEELLSLDKSKRLHFGSSIADMLALSASNILIAAGSTFSMWASYLGRMPIIWYRGQLRQRLYYNNPGIEIEMTEEDKIPWNFIENLKMN